MHDKAFKREQVVEIINSVVSRVTQARPADNVLRREVESLKRAIDAMRADLDFAHPGQIQSHIPQATGELDAIVSSTESATFTIMSACEEIQKLLQGRPLEESASIEGQIIRIVEACTFQDLTGQRISKIVRALKEIDRHAAALSRVLGDSFSLLQEQAAPAALTKDPLLNGPQLPGQGISQDEIDRLLNDFN